METISVVDPNVPADILNTQERKPGDTNRHDTVTSKDTPKTLEAPNAIASTDTQHQTLETPTQPVYPWRKKRTEVTQYPIYTHLQVHTKKCIVN